MNCILSVKSELKMHFFINFRPFGGGHLRLKVASLVFGILLTALGYVAITYFPLEGTILYLVPVGTLATYMLLHPQALQDALDKETDTTIRQSKRKLRFLISLVILGMAFITFLPTKLAALFLLPLGLLIGYVLLYVDNWDIEVENEAEDGRNLSHLLLLSRQISEIVDLDDLLDAVINTMEKIIPFDAGGIFLIDDYAEFFYAKKIKGYKSGKFRDLRLKLEVGIIGKAIREKRTIIINNVADNRDYYSLRESTKSQLTSPLFVGGEVIGVFSLESNQIDYFVAKDIDYLNAFAGMAAIAIRNAKLYRDSQIKNLLENEMINAAQVQAALLPASVSAPAGYELHCHNIPSLRVGGDIFDVGGTNSDFLLAIGDVSGKGTSGAILMAVLLAGIRSTQNRNLDIRERMHQINNLLTDSTVPGKYATFFLSSLNASRHVLTFCNAGHNTPILLRNDGEVVPLETGGIVIGFIKDSIYETAKVTLDSGEIIVFFTDGLTEAINADEEEFGMQRLLHVASECHHCPADEVAAKILAAVQAWVGEAGLQDDLTLLVLRRK
jgi:sigma-B regulation protein RsbU (phosphoserine phosphatase)